MRPGQIRPGFQNIFALMSPPANSNQGPTSQEVRALLKQVANRDQELERLQEEAKRQAKETEEKILHLLLKSIVDDAITDLLEPRFKKEASKAPDRRNRKLQEGVELLKQRVLDECQVSMRKFSIDRNRLENGKTELKTKIRYHLERKYGTEPNILTSNDAAIPRNTLFGEDDYIIIIKYLNQRLENAFREAFPPTNIVIQNSAITPPVEVPSSGGLKKRRGGRAKNTDEIVLLSVTHEINQQSNNKHNASYTAPQSFMQSAMQQLLKKSKQSADGKNSLATVIFNDNKLADQFSQGLLKIGIENRGMKGTARKVEMSSTLGDETYKITLTKEEYNLVMQDDNAFDKVIQQQASDNNNNNVPVINEGKQEDINYGMKN